MALYGEAGPEAYVPLPDGRSIPVAMRGGGGGHIFNIGGPQLTVQGSMASATLPQVQAMLAESARQQNRLVQRNFGTMSAHFNSLHNPAV